MEGPGGQMSAMSVMSESAPTTRCDSSSPLAPAGHGRSRRSTIFSSPSPCASSSRESSTGAATCKQHETGYGTVLTLELVHGGVASRLSM